MRTLAPRSAFIILILIFALFACASDPPESAADAPAAGTDAPAAEDKPESTEEAAPATTYNACDMLTQAEIDALAFRDYPVGEPISGTDSPVFLGDAVSCAWEVGDPEAQFHERLHLYIITLDREDPSAAFDGQVGRLIRAEERSGVGDRAAYASSSGILAVLDGDFLFLIRASFDTSEDGEAKLTELAQLVISRK